MISDNNTFFRSFPLENIHPTALIGLPPENRNHKRGRLHKGVEVDRTARIGAYCTVDGGYEDATRIGERVFAMKGCHIGHDAQIGDDTELAPHAVVGGHVVIGRKVRIGMGAILRNRVRIGDGAVVGAGAIVTKDVPPHEVWVGNPARKLRNAFDDYARTVGVSVLKDVGSEPPTEADLEYGAVVYELAEDAVARQAEREQTDAEMWNEQFERGRTR